MMCFIFFGLAFTCFVLVGNELPIYIQIFKNKNIKFGMFFKTN